MKINFVSSGNFSSCKIKKSKKFIYIQNKNLEKIYLTNFFIDGFELIYYTDSENIKNDSKQKYSVMIYFKTGQKSLLELNKKFYNLLVKELS